MSPRTETWDTGIFVIGSYGFETVKVFVYTIIQRVILLLILFIGFLISDKYMHFGFITGMALQIYRIVGVFNPNVRQIDQWEWLFVIPVSFIAIWMLLILHRKVNDKLKIVEMVTQIDQKIADLKKKKESY